MGSEMCIRDRNPVVPLVLALYGHPDAGGFWEEQCDAAVKSCGFTDFKDSGWRSTYWHPKEKALLVVYVDDFNLSAPAAAQSRLWKQLMAKLNLEEPSEPNRFLGCYKRAFTAKAKDLERSSSISQSYTQGQKRKREKQRGQSLSVASKNIILKQRCAGMFTIWMNMSERT